jgi:AraC family transcriptional regulator
MNAAAADVQHPSPVVLKRGAAWDGIRLTHYRFRAGSLPEHSHPEHLVTVSLGGGCKAEVRTASGFRTRDKVRGSVCVIPAGAPFTTRIEDDSEYLAIYLEPSLVARAASEAGASRGPFEVVESCSMNDPVVRSVGLALLAELERDNLGGRLYAESLANVLAVHLLRRYTTAGVGAAPRFTGGLGGQRLRQVTDFIADNYGGDLSLDDLARAAGMSTFHFAREFKRTTGTTPHQYLIKFRVERAKALLAEGGMPLVEVGAQSGFSHQSHFTRLFRRLTGTTPQSYRLMFQS